MTTTANGTQDGITSTADAATGSIRVVADIAASPEAVFRALTDPKEILQWWGGQGGMYQPRDWESDLRPGGKWKGWLESKGDASKMTDVDAPGMTVEGEYITVDPPRLLEYTWSPTWDGLIVTRVRCEIEPTSFGSRITLTHTGFGDREGAMGGHKEGWLRGLRGLSVHLQSRQGFRTK